MTSPHATNVLVVDDEPKNLVALEAALASVDYGVVMASSGRDALKALLSQDFAVIVLDIHMPDMDGFETARLIRARERSSSTPIVFLTADDRVGAQVFEGYRLGAVDYLYKPFVAHVLRAKVAVFVELFRKSAALEHQTQALLQVTADLRLREGQVDALIADLEVRVVERTAELEQAIGHVEAESKERVRSEAPLHSVERSHIPQPGG
jgi:DNA-binding response OmpR family regulator